ncbi:leucine rich repeat containing 42 [Plakobranchus ocellatus]|uniref:Leucine-rich repeat-containing protein 42 n=1 Tax=Plakobranchus ocellatus TaxID=259542 RepID=A0AAV4D4L0_9GAST|nr:leucine rich repeat containing 42 [Plakobranchus ocellatus]
MQPEPLFVQCLNFICENLKCLDSLIGFPESIGQKIFSAAFYCQHHPSHKGTLSKTKAGDDFRNTLQVFFLAYGSCGILQSLSVRDDPLFLSDTIDDCWWLYQFVSHLDLAFCGLGDNHDILPLLLGSTNHLQTLILKGNSLSDEGVRKLTLKQRMFIGKASTLEVLDLSENVGVTVKSLRFSKCLINLVVLNASLTGISTETWRRQDSVNRWRILPRDYESSTGCGCIRSWLNVVTSGWGARAVQMWRDQCVQARHQRVMFRSSQSIRLALTSDKNSCLPTFYSKGGPSCLKKVQEGSCVGHSSTTDDNDFLLVSDALFAHTETDYVSKLRICHCQCVAQSDKNYSSLREDLNHSGLFDNKLKIHQGDTEYGHFRSGRDKSRSTIHGVESPTKQLMHKRLKRCHRETPEKPSPRCRETISSASFCDQSGSEENIQALLSQYNCHQSDPSRQPKQDRKSLIAMLGDYSPR